MSFLPRVCWRHRCVLESGVKLALVSIWGADTNNNASFCQHSSQQPDELLAYVLKNTTSYTNKIKEGHAKRRVSYQTAYTSYKLIHMTLSNQIPTLAFPMRRISKTPSNI